jgi:hypothetical protein
MFKKKLLPHYLLTNSSDLQTLPTGINDTSIQSQQIFVSPTQSNIVPQHQYASAPNDTSRILSINTSPSTNFYETFDNHETDVETDVDNNELRSMDIKQRPSKIPVAIYRHKKAKKGTNP